MAPPVAPRVAQRIAKVVLPRIAPLIPLQPSFLGPVPALRCCLRPTALFSLAIAGVPRAPQSRVFQLASLANYRGGSGVALAVQRATSFPNLFFVWAGLVRAAPAIVDAQQQI